MVQIFYIITKNEELIYVQNFRKRNADTAKKAIKRLYESIKHNKRVSNINFSETELNFINDNIEKHKIFINKEL